MRRISKAQQRLQHECGGMLLPSGPNYAIPGFQIDVPRNTGKHPTAMTLGRESRLIPRTNEAHDLGSMESFLKSYDLTALRQVSSRF